jgi:hypothetical protein
VDCGLKIDLETSTYVGTDRTNTGNRQEKCIKRYRKQTGIIQEKYLKKTDDRIS